MSRLLQGVQREGQLEDALAASALARLIPGVRPEMCTSGDCLDVDNAIV